MALEVLEVLSRRMKALEHPVVFLFNGAEEKGLLVITWIVCGIVYFERIISF